MSDDRAKSGRFESGFSRIRIEGERSEDRNTVHHKLIVQKRNQSRTRRRAAGSPWNAVT